MDVRDLKYFEAIAESEHLGRAATVVFRTQPALTKCIERLETELEVELFVRSGRKLVLTEAGRLLQFHARSMRQQMDDVCREMKAFGQGAVGQVRLGASATAAEYLLPHLAARLVKHAALKLSITVGTNDALYRAVAAGELDLAVCPLSYQLPELSSTRIGKDQVVVVASPTHPLFKKKKVKIEDLCQFRWVLPVGSSANRSWLFNTFEKAGLPLPVVQIESTSISLTPRLISGTDLLTSISRRNLAIQNVSSSLKEIPVPQVVMSRDICVIWRANAYISPATYLIKKHLEELGTIVLRGD